MKQPKYHYAIPPSKLVTEDYFDTKMTEDYHYRKLEDLEDPAVQEWYKAQGRIFLKIFLAEIDD